MIALPRTRTVALVLVLAWLGSAAAAVAAAPWLALAILLAGGIVVAAARAGRRTTRAIGSATGAIPTLARVERFLESIDRLPLERLRMLALTTGGARTAHDDAVDRALEAAAAHGRRAAAADLRRAVDDGIARRFAEGGYDATMFGLGWRPEPAQPIDRVRIAAAVSDAALAMLVEDLVDDPTFVELTTACATVLD